MKRIMIDLTKCDGCKNCALACMQAHRSSGSLYDLDLSDGNNEARNSLALDRQKRVIPLFCRHCEEPECVLSCMSGAMCKDPDTGYVLYDEEKCASCFMCVMNCPYGVLKPDRQTKTKVMKCDFCKTDNYEPNCVKSCPKSAIYLEEVATK